MTRSLSLIGLFSLLTLMGCPPTDPKDSETEETGGGGGGAEEVDPSLASAGDDIAVSEMTDYEMHATLQGVVGETFEGTSTYGTAINATTACDSESTVTGTAYTGECEGCDFAFALETTATRDDSTADCTNSASMSFTEDEFYYGLILAYVPEYVYEGYYGTYTYSQILQTGYSVDYYGSDYPGPYWDWIHYDGATYSTLEFDGTNLAWTFDYAGSYASGVNYYYYCDYPYAYEADEFTPTYSGTGSFPCGTGEGDTWTFEAPEGATANIMVDTVGDSTAFDAVMWVNGPDSCTLAVADDQFDCTYPPPTYACPSMELEDLEAGTYEIVISDYGDCAGTTSDYSLSVQVLSE